MAPKAKAKGLDPRTMTIAQRREAFLGKKKESAKDWHVLKDDEQEELIPYNFIVLDHVLKLYGMAGRGSVIQLHGDEGAGKCLPSNSLISSKDGLLYLDEIFTMKGLKATNTTRTTKKEYGLVNRYGEIESTSIFTHNGSRPVFPIRTRSGNVIEATANHPHLIMSEDGFLVWKKVSEIKKGDFLVTTRSHLANTDIGAQEYVDPDELYFLGNLLADGTFSDTRIAFTNSEPYLLYNAKYYGEKLFEVEHKAYPKADSEGCFDLHFNNKKKVHSLYKKLGWAVGTAKDKHLGKWIRSLSTNNIRSVLQGYFDCECSIDSKGIEVCSASHKLLFEIKAVLMAHFGILSILNPKKVKGYEHNEYWRLTITGVDASRFMTEVGFRTEQRLASTKLFLKDMPVFNTNIDSIPNIGRLLSTLYDSSETTVAHNQITRDYKGSRPTANVSYAKLEEILDFDWADSFAKDRLQEILDQGHFYDQIVAIDEPKIVPTFDFEMPESHSFQVANLITHNSTVAYCINREYQRATQEPIVYFDFERTTTAEYLTKIGIDMEMAHVERPDTMESAVQTAVDYMSKGVRLFTFDSIPRMKSKIDEKLIKNGKAFGNQPGQDALMMKKFYDVMLPYIAGVDGRLLMVNQTRSRIEMSQEAKSANGGYATITNLAYVLPGGKANRFAINVMLELTLQKAFKPGKCEDEFLLEAEAKHGEQYLANRVRIRSLKNKVSGTGYREGHIWIRPGFGMDEGVSVREIARQFKLIAAHGKRWYVGESIENAIHVFDDKAAAIEGLVNNPDPDIMNALRNLTITRLRADDSSFSFDLDDDSARYLAGEAVEDIEEVDHSMEVELADTDDI